MDLKEQGQLGVDERTHWYYVSKGRAFQSVLGKSPFESMVDIGAGTGVFSRQLIDAGFCRRATCVDPAYSAEWVEPNDGKPLSFVRTAEYRGEDLVLLADVLEHVDDDVGLLRQYTSQLPPRARVLISVPAYEFLWSGHDEYLEHRRRYTKAGIERVVRESGLRVDKTRFFFALLFPIAAATRILDRVRPAGSADRSRSVLRKHSAVTNSFLTGIHQLERRLILPFNGLFGLTIICLARPA